MGGFLESWKIVGVFEFRKSRSVTSAAVAVFLESEPEEIVIGIATGQGCAGKARSESQREGFENVEVEFVGLLIVDDDPAGRFGCDEGTAAKFFKKSDDIGLLGALQRDVGVPISHRISGNDAQSFAGVDGLAFFGEEAFHRACFWRADFVLHFHGFDDEKTLAGFDGVTGLDEEANDLPRHGGEDLLAAFEFGVSVAAAAPGARVEDFSGEFVKAGVNF